MSQPKTKRERRRRRDRATGEKPAAPQPPPPPTKRDISWLGLIAGVLGALLLGQAAVYAIVSPGDSGSVIAIPLFAMAATYLPAVWASVAQTPHRQRVQRGVLIVTLVLVVVGVLLIDVAFATLLLIPSTLLAIAAGLVFQGGPAGPKRKAGR